MLDRLKILKNIIIGTIIHLFLTASLSMVLVGQGRLFFTTLFYKLFNLKEEESL
jgi:hypothetical protein